MGFLFKKTPILLNFFPTKDIYIVVLHFQQHCAAGAF